MTTSQQTMKSEILHRVNMRADHAMQFVIIIFFLTGFVFAFFYETFSIAMISGGLCLLGYFGTKVLLRDYELHRYVLSAVFAVFTAQYIYQMHGMFEMHFFVFVGSTLLIAYQNWKLQLPLLLLVVLHHASFAYLQYSGSSEIYFTQLSHMDLITFVIHAALAAVIIGICGYRAYDLEKRTREEEKINRQLVRLTDVNRSIRFAEEISRGHLLAEFQAEEKDELGKALLKMRENLLEANRREQEEKFITIGINKVGDIIRNQGQDLATLSDEFIKGVVKYLNVCQGALFLREDTDNDIYLTLTACYAYERKKYVEKRLHHAEGLIGQCFQEKGSIYMTDVPGNYVKITSGLGEATPRCVLLTPVMANDNIVGVLELAAFKPFTQTEIEFIKRATENVASTIVSSRTTERIKRLLDESQTQTEMMKAQEEEMRQNMEELAATQEELVRKAAEYERQLAERNDTVVERNGTAVEKNGIAAEKNRVVVVEADTGY
jgi:methyl-accepting chemotaxis protein